MTIDLSTINPRKAEKLLYDRLYAYHFQQAPLVAANANVSIDT